MQRTLPVVSGMLLLLCGMLPTSRVEASTRYLCMTSCYTIRLPQVWFVNNSFSPLRDTAFYMQHSWNTNIDDVLDDVVQVLEENPTIIIELSGHAGQLECHPEELAKGRAELAACLLMDRGIDHRRLVCKAWGAWLTEEEVVSMGGQEEQENARQLNRTVNFRVHSFDFVPHDYDDIAVVRSMRDVPQYGPGPGFSCERSHTTLDDQQLLHCVALCMQPKAMEDDPKDNDANIELDPVTLLGNPVAGNESLLLWNGTGAPLVTIELTAIDGRQLGTVWNAAVEDHQRLVLSLPNDLAPGNYLLRIVANGTPTTVRFIKGR